MGARELQVPQQRGRVVRHLGGGVQGVGGEVGLADAAVVEGDHLEVGRERLHL